VRKRRIDHDGLRREGDHLAQLRAALENGLMTAALPLIAKMPTSAARA